MSTSGTIRTSRPAALLFGVMLAHALLETARDALFLVRLGPSQLAWAYVAIAGAAVVAVAAQRRWCRNRDARNVLVGFVWLAATGTAALAGLIAIVPAAVFVLYVWTGLVATLVVPAFWTVIDRSVRVGDAKRVFSAIAAGGVLGALVGSALATVIGRLAGAFSLVWVGTGVFVVCALAASTLAPRNPTEAPRVTRHRDRTVSRRRSRRYVRVLLLGGLLATVALTLGDLMFKRFVVDNVAGEDLATAFGATYAGLNLLGLVIQLAVTPRLFERLGVGSTLTLLPVLLIASALGFAITGGAIAILALKLADGGLRHSVYRVAHEILFLPLPAKLRDSTKPMIDAIGMRGGQALAAVGTFAIAGDDNALLGVVTVGAAFAWLIAVVVTRYHYVQQFRDTLDHGDIQRDVAVPTLDGRSISILTAALSSPDEAEARAALDLLARRGDRIPALVLYHPSPAIVRRALSLLEGTLRADVERVLRHLTTHADPAIRAAALAAASRTGCHMDRLSAGLDDPEPEVRAAAIVGFAVAKRDASSLEGLLAGSPAERVALAAAIARDPRPMFRPALDALLSHREPAVTREVLRIWARTPALADGARLLDQLADPNVRGDARRAILAGGTRYFDLLLGALDDPRTPIAVRRHLPRTISRYKTAAAATALVSRLVREPDGTTEFKILRALGRLRADAATLPIDHELVHLYIRRASEDAVRYSALAQRLAAEPHPRELEASVGLLHELLVEKRHHAVERVFRALGIVHPRADLRGLHDGITSGDAARRDAAREVLEALLPSMLRGHVLAALSPDDQPARYTTYEDLFAALLTDPSDSLRCIAAHHIAERRLVALRSELTRLRPYSSSLVGHAFDQAIARLDA